VDDEEADARKNLTSTENKSVLTGRTMGQIKKDSGKKELSTEKIKQSGKEKIRKKEFPEWTDK
jgi:hypothetical protein